MVGLTATQFSLGLVMSPTGRSATRSPPSTATPAAFLTDPTSEEPVLPAEDEQRVADLPMVDDDHIASPLRQGSVLDGGTAPSQPDTTNRSAVLPFPETGELAASGAAATAVHVSSFSATAVSVPSPGSATPLRDSFSPD
jgi:hypothetical protein